DKYFIFLGNKLYKLDDTSTIKIPVLSNQFKSTNIKGYNRMLPQFRVNDKYVWFNYYPKDSNKLISVKYDLNHQKIVYSKEIKSPFLFPFYDDFDYNYIYIPINDHTIVRKFVN